MTGPEAKLPSAGSTSGSVSRKAEKEPRNSASAGTAPNRPDPARPVAPPAPTSTGSPAGAVTPSEENQPLGPRLTRWPVTTEPMIINTEDPPIPGGEWLPRQGIPIGAEQGRFTGIESPGAPAVPADCGAPAHTLGTYLNGPLAQPGRGVGVSGPAGHPPERTGPPPRDFSGSPVSPDERCDIISLFQGRCARVSSCGNM